MNPQIKTHPSIREQELIIECECDHCIGIKKQQIESEKRWILMHKLFDR